jgi:hypothetical protein
MVNILDLCSGKWEQEMGGDSEWEAVCTGWHPAGQQSAAYTGLSQRVREPVAVMMPPELMDQDLDEFLRRMQNA